MNWMNNLSRINECATIGKCKVGWLLFADNSVLLASSEFGLLHALNGFTTVCDMAEMKISTYKPDVLHFEKQSRKFRHCNLCAETFWHREGQLRLPLSANGKGMN